MCCVASQCGVCSNKIYLYLLSKEQMHSRCGRHSFLQLKDLSSKHSTALQSYIACINHFDALKVSILKQQVSKLGNKHIITNVRVEYVWLDIAVTGSSIFTHLWLVKIYLLYSCNI